MAKIHAEPDFGYIAPNPPIIQSTRELDSIRSDALLRPLFPSKRSQGGQSFRFQPLQHLRYQCQSRKVLLRVRSGFRRSASSCAPVDYEVATVAGNLSVCAVVSPG